MSYPKTDEERQQMLQQYIDEIDRGRNMIFDRCWYSEMVYGPVMRDGSVISYPNMYELEAKLAKRGAMIIYCTDKPATLWRRAVQRGEDFVKEFGTFTKIYDGFEAVMNVPHLVPVVKYGYKDL
jgi:polyphosphate kinase 2 (PPK2 family)